MLTTGTRFRACGGGNEEVAAGARRNGNYSLVDTVGVRPHCLPPFITSPTPWLTLQVIAMKETSAVFTPGFVKYALPR